MLELNFRELGSGPPVVVAHGLFGSASNWQSIAREFADRHRLLLVDLRNHGDSPRSDVMDYSVMAADLAGLIERECDGTAALVGHSMGGKAAMTLALTQPELVERLAVIDTAPAEHDSSIGRYVEALAAVPLAEIESRRDADALLADAAPEAGLRAFLLTNLRRTEAGWEWRINLPVIAKALPALAAFPDLGRARYDGPTLFIAGENSDYVTAAHLTAARQWFPAARRQVVAGAGHWVHAERPAETVAALAAFLSE